MQKMLFDAYLMVDWSAAAKPKRGRDSIWIGLATRGGDLSDPEPENPHSRAEAGDRVGELLRSLTERGLRVLVGFDFPYGYPHGLAAALRVRGGLPPWRSTWDRLAGAIRDDERNRNNRFEVASQLNAELGTKPGPFWGCPSNQQTETLSMKGCAFPYEAAGQRLERLRVTERRLRGVQEAWKLFGNGAVGSQALVGIPHVTRLCDAPGLAPLSRVWPFETGFTDAPSPERGPFVLHAEIWPGIAPIEARRHPIRDAAQVLTLAHHFAALDERGDLGGLFSVPGELAPADLAACIEEEGWILGA